MTTNASHQPAENTSRNYKVAALYKFVALDDFQDLQQPILAFCKAYDIKGTLLLAQEGINGTIAGPHEAIDNLIAYLSTDPMFEKCFQDLDVKFSFASTPPFLRIRVRLKKEIVTLKAPEASPTRQVGTYVDSEDWNTIISDPEMVVLDTRNDYEVSIGTFEGAIDPKTTTFTEFKDFVSENLNPDTHKKVAMFCTGGIRCEKASSYMLAHGFDQVYHLKGGILKYLETIPEDNSLWQGDCFVFDERVAVGAGLKEGGYTQCHACRHPLSANDRESPDFIQGIQCSFCKDKKTEADRKRAASRQRQIELAKQRGITHIGDQANDDANRMREEKLMRKFSQA
ncbi:MAG: rhodanese-related sulfurtransferase [Pseudomonadota bacterium]